MITVQLLGGASLRSDDGPLTGPPAQRHRIALLTLVAAAWPQPLARDRALALLWPEKDTTGARRLLNLSVHVLRSALGDDAIASSGDGLLLDPTRITCDLHQFRGAIAAGDVERAVALYAGPLLDGFHLDESTEFGYWLDEHRSALVHAYVGALRELAQRQEQAGDLHGRVGTCRKLEIPVAPTGDVEGEIHGLEDTPRSGVEVDVVDSDGHIVASTLSEYDGYFLIERVPYGTYRLKISDGAARALGAQADLNKTFVLSNEKSQVQLGVLRLHASQVAEAATGRANTASP